MRSHLPAGELYDVIDGLNARARSNSEFAVPETEEPHDLYLRLALTGRCSALISVDGATAI